MKVLIAEDNPMWRRMLEDHVTGWGYEAEVAEDGEQAWKILQRDDSPRLAILDWLMPGIDGIDVCRRVKQSEELPFTYVVMLTGRDAQEDMIAGLDAGADDYLTKPVEPAILRSRLLAAGRIVQAVPPKEWTTPRVPGYDVKQLLGKGAFATVWQAVQESTGRSVALKIIRVELATHEVFGRFAREIQLMQKMDHSNIARVYDSNIDEKLGYYAMELVDGWTLEKYIKDEKPKARRILELFAQVCDGLDHAHQQGIVHRDMKPSNIMISRKGLPKLVDFGLGKSMFLADTASDQSMVGQVVGTPLFMAPEQARGENDKVDGRTDVYALGIILYILFVRRHPHKVSDKNRWQTVQQIAEGHARLPSELVPDFDVDLERIIMKALAYEPSERFQSAAEFGEELRHFVQQRKMKKKD